MPWNYNYTTHVVDKFVSAFIFIRKKKKPFHFCFVFFLFLLLCVKEIRRAICFAQLTAGLCMCVYVLLIFKRWSLSSTHFCFYLSLPILDPILIRFAGSESKNICTHIHTHILLNTTDKFCLFKFDCIFIISE